MLFLSNSFVRNFFPVFIFSPIFLSISSDFNIHFNRVVGASGFDWLISLPLSLFVVFLLFSSAPIKIISSVLRVDIFLVIYLIACAIIIFSSDSKDMSAIKTLGMLFGFLVSYYTFNYFFHYLRQNNYFNGTSGKFLFKVPFLLVFFVSIISQFFVTAVPYLPLDLVTERVIYDNQEHMPSVIDSSAFIWSGFTIYNYEQYFALVFLLLLPIVSKISFSLLVIVFILSIEIAVVSENRTALILLSIVFMYEVMRHSFSKLPIGFNKYFNRMSILCFCLMVFFPLFYLVSMYLFPYPESLDSSLLSRHNYIVNYVDNFNIINVFLPLDLPSRIISADMHNELLEVFNASSLSGTIFFYYSFIHKVYSVYKIDKSPAIAILCLVFVGGVMSSSLTHMYLFIVVAYALAYYANCLDNKVSD